MKYVVLMMCIHYQFSISIFNFTVRLLSLQLENFRSYESLTIDFSDTEQTNVLFGDNGSGKTNVVEALSYLSQGRSCLGVKPEQALQWGKGHFRMSAAIRTDAGDDRTVEFVFQVVPERASACFLQDVKVPFTKFLGNLPAMFFLPQDLDLFTGSPAQRRSFLDSLLVQLSPSYIPLRMRFERTLKQRNALLKRIDAGEASETDLDAWDHEFATLGAEVQHRRLTLCHLIEERLADDLRLLGERWTSMAFTCIRSTSGNDQKSIETDVLSLLRARRTKDIPAGATTAGPHRDDWLLSVDHHPLGIVGSRGQQRAGFVALLFRSVALIEERKAEKPIILLDDVLSELDAAHQEALLSRCAGYQTIITAAGGMPKAGECSVWEVGGGEVRIKN